ncbi:TetR/AcrR family transcriptional regulator [Novosphingobium sp. 1949]|uniref:TetR/AcrR family transcriptional regulator n=1 Tax=Novosphingobium organovorum TaxID=2930092 RepID=A0ABT0BH82_9SPHN|nr:TetR/AcrR family transcriptional regulator [Novosphingobium organovorum]MCJ2184397.1 TetR/AcrR family transcriptional regulator [Novosphingobium organovorum]
MTQKGYATISVEAVAAAANLTKGSFYHHFTSKADFGIELIRSYGAYFQRRLSRFLDRDDLSPLDCLMAFTQDARISMARHEYRRGCLIGNLSQEVGSLPSAFRDLLEQELGVWETMTARCLNTAKQRGEIHEPLDPEILAHHFWTGWEGAVMRAKLQRSGTPLSDFADSFLTLITR